jgi:hypothetical protein
MGLNEFINIHLVFYEKKKDGIIIEYNLSDYEGF